MASRATRAAPGELTLGHAEPVRPALDPDQLARIEEKLDRVLEILGGRFILVEEGEPLREDVTVEQAAQEIWDLLCSETKSLLPSEIMERLNLTSGVVLDALEILKDQGSVVSDTEGE